MSDMMITVRTETERDVWEEWPSGTHTAPTYADAKSEVLRMAELELVGLKAANYSNLTYTNVFEDLTAGSRAYDVLITHRFGTGPRDYGRTLISAIEVKVNAESE